MAVNRADKVAEQTWAVAECPVCKQPIEGVITVEVRLGGVRLNPHDVNDTVEAVADVETRLRGMVVSHRCTSDPEPAAVEG